MATFRLYDNNIIYLYHWVNSRQPFKYSTGIKVDPEKWDKSKKRPKSHNLKYKGKNVIRELSRIENAFYDAMNHFEINGGFSTLKLREKIRENLSGASKIPTGNQSRFLTFYEEQVESYKAQNINNWKGYNNTLNHLKKFFGRRAPDFEDIDLSFFIKYNSYLNSKELSANSISDHWKFIKAMMRKSQLLKFHSNTDYQLFKQVKGEPDTIFLTEDELQKLFELKLSGYLDKARDYFLIGAYTGLRFADWDKVSMSKINEGQIIIRNSKTGEKSIIPIAPNVIRILNKYENGVLPKKPSNQKINDYIKDVVKEAKINEPTEVSIIKGGKRVTETKPKYELVSTHTARRSYATIMVLNGVAPHLIMMVTSHKTLSSFEKYVRFDELQASIKLKETESFKNSFGEALTWSEKLQHDPEFRKERKKILLK